MKLFRCLLALTAIAGVFSSAVVFAANEQDNSRFDEELNERDFDALRDFLKSRKAVDVAEETTNLVISGDVRTEWRHMTEHCKGKNLRGRGATDLSGRPISRNDFDIEFNLYFNYVFNDFSWAVTQVRYDNSAGVDDNEHPCFFDDDEITGCGIGCKEGAEDCDGDPQGYHGSGRCNDLCLKKAYMGFMLYKGCYGRFDLELGRRGNLYNVFDSNVQFLSRFDGLLLKYDNTWESVADWYVHAAAFVVDERSNHYAYIAEVGLMDIAEMGIDLKYSFIDWKKNGKNRCFVHDPRGFRCQNSQVLAAYHLDPDVLGKPVKFYGAFVINTAANKLTTRCLVDGVIVSRKHGRQNMAWYAGVLVGEVRKEGDWAIEIQYQAVQAQAVPDDDCSGICRGNVLDESFTTCSRRGNTNFQGMRLEGLYAFTDDMTLDTIIEYSKALDSHIGGSHSYSKVELEAIYAF